MSWPGVSAGSGAASLVFPVLIAVFVALFTWSAALTFGRRRVRWRGRVLEVREGPVSNGQIVLLDALVWAAWSAVVGYAAHRLPLRRLDHDAPFTRLRTWERGGRVYERVGIRRWKDRLPDFGAVFRGGASKRSLRSRDTPHLTRFAAETRRAEIVHWAIPLVTPPVRPLESGMARRRHGGVRRGGQRTVPDRPALQPRTAPAGAHPAQPNVGPRPACGGGVIRLLVAASALVAMEPAVAAVHRWVMHGRGWAWHRSHHRWQGHRIEANDLYPVVFAAATIATMAVGAAIEGLAALVWVGVG